MLERITLEIANKKLEKIADIWNHYIWKYSFCNQMIKFNDDQRTNYFGDILTYFHDTFPILTEEYTSSKFFRENIGNGFAFLQTIYVHQDFVEELHFIFKTGVVKGDLKADSNYYLNREIRNETIGHPIRKIEIPKSQSSPEISTPIEECKHCGRRKERVTKKQVLLSSTIISNSFDSETIRYIKYHRDKNFQFEEIVHNRSDILLRHEEFLEKNFDIVLRKLKVILRKFLKKLKEIEEVKKRVSFDDLLKILEHSIESIFSEDYLFEKKSLLELYNRRKEHLRYQSVIDSFFRKVNIYLDEMIVDIEMLILCF